MAVALLSSTVGSAPSNEISERHPMSAASVAAIATAIHAGCAHAAAADVSMSEAADAGYAVAGQHAAILPDSGLAGREFRAASDARRFESDTAILEAGSAASQLTLHLRVSSLEQQISSLRHQLRLQAALGRIRVHAVAADGLLQQGVSTLKLLRQLGQQKHVNVHGSNLARSSDAEAPMPDTRASRRSSRRHPSTSAVKAHELDSIISGLSDRLAASGSELLGHHHAIAADAGAVVSMALSQPAQAATQAFDSAAKLDGSTMAGAIDLLPTGISFGYLSKLARVREEGSGVVIGNDDDHHVDDADPSSSRHGQLSVSRVDDAIRSHALEQLQQQGSDDDIDGSEARLATADIDFLLGIRKLVVQHLPSSSDARAEVIERLDDPVAGGASAGVDAEAVSTSQNDEDATASSSSIAPALQESPVASAAPAEPGPAAAAETHHDRATATTDADGTIATSATVAAGTDSNKPAQLSEAQQPEQHEQQLQQQELLDLEAQFRVTDPGAGPEPAAADPARDQDETDLQALLDGSRSSSFVQGGVDGAEPDVDAQQPASAAAPAADSSQQAAAPWTSLGQEAYPEYPEIPHGIGSRFPLAVSGLLDHIHIPGPLESPYAPTVEEAVLLQRQFMSVARTAAAADEIRAVQADGNQHPPIPRSRRRPTLFPLNRTAISIAREAREVDRLKLQLLGVRIAFDMPSFLPPERRQHGGGNDDADDDDLDFARAEAIRRGFEHAWHAYVRAGWGADIYRPLSNVTDGDLCKMGETLVDALDTAIIMGLHQPYADARKWIDDVFPTLVGGQADINLFECTIRIVGGLISIHELAGDRVWMDAAELAMRAMVESGPFASQSGLPFGTLYLAPRVENSNGNSDGAATLSASAAAEQQGQLPAGDDVAVAANPASIAPYNATKWRRKVASDVSIPEFSGTGVKTDSGHAYNPAWISGWSSISEVSTLQLELAAISRYTGIFEYHEAGRKVMRHLLALSPPNGLYPIYIDPNSGQMKDVQITLGARGDSLYEYLLKQWIYLGSWSFEEERAEVMANLAVEIAMVGFELEQNCGDANRRSNGDASDAPGGNVDGEAAVGIEEQMQLGTGDGAAVEPSSTSSSPASASASASTLPGLDPGLLPRLQSLLMQLLAVMGRANDDDPRYLLHMYNKAVTGIMDRLLQKSTPSGYWYIAEAEHSAAAMPEGQDPNLIHKMDHLVCFFPGMLSLGLVHSAGHEILALEQEMVIRTGAIVRAIQRWENRTGRVHFHAAPTSEAEHVPAGGGDDAGSGNSHGDNAPSHAQQQQQEETGSSDPNAVQIAVPLPPRFDTPTSIEFVQRILSMMDRWMTDPSSLKSLPVEIVATALAQADLQNINCADIPSGRPGGGGAGGGEGPAGRRAAGQASGSAEAAGESGRAPQQQQTQQRTVSAPDPIIDPFGSLRKPTKIRSFLQEASFELVRTCNAMYERTATGLAPEIVTFRPGQDFEPNHDARHCLLRPETVESMYVLDHLMRMDGIGGGAVGGVANARAPAADAQQPHQHIEQEQQQRQALDLKEWAWSIFDSIEQHARVRSGGYASVKDVQAQGYGLGSIKEVELAVPASSDAVTDASDRSATDGGDKATAAAGGEKAQFGPLSSAGRINMSDKMESFHLAETMKYLYLIFYQGSRDVIDLREWVFNTEAHPLRAIRADAARDRASLSSSSTPANDGSASSVRGGDASESPDWPSQWRNTSRSSLVSLRMRQWLQQRKTD